MHETMTIFWCRLWQSYPWEEKSLSSCRIQTESICYRMTPQSSPWTPAPSNGSSLFSGHRGINTRILGDPRRTPLGTWAVLQKIIQVSRQSWSLTSGKPDWSSWSTPLVMRSTRASEGLKLGWLTTRHRVLFVVVEFVLLVPWHTVARVGYRWTHGRFCSSHYLIFTFS